MKYQCIIVEDNAVERDLLEVLLRKMEEIEIAGVFENGLEALVFLQQNTVDLAFTDIDMPQLTGIGLLKSLRNPPLFVFISAHSKYAADGYDLDVLDFVRKPLQPDRLYRALDKALGHLNKKAATVMQPEDGILTVRTSDGINKLAIASIVYAESKANYSVLYLTNNTSLMVLIGMKQLEEQLPQNGFIRIHKNYLINWQLAERIGKESVLLMGKHEVPIGDSYRKELTERIAAYPSLERRKEK